MKTLPTFHPLSMAATQNRKAAAALMEDQDEVKPSRRGKPMGGSRRKKIYRQQTGSKVMTPAQARRYHQKVRRNGYIPK